MLIRLNDLREALQDKMPGHIPENHVEQLARPLFLKGKTAYYQDTDLGRLKVTIVRDPKGRIAVTEPKRVA